MALSNAEEGDPRSCRGQRSPSWAGLWAPCQGGGHTDAHPNGLSNPSYLLWETTNHCVTLLSCAPKADPKEGLSPAISIW